MSSSNSTKFTDEDIMVSDLEIMAKAINYRRWLYDQVRPYVGKRVVEYGCGVGNYIEFLSEAERIVAMDTHPETLEVLRRRYPSDPRLTTMKIEVGRDLGVLAKERCDTVLCFNVMEHIEDHERVTRDLFDALVPGGRLCLIVPAAKWAYGTVDIALKHFRRYQMSEVKALVTGAGFEIETAYPLNFVGVFGWFLNNRILRKKTESSSQVVVFDKFFVPWIRAVESIVKPPFGLSIVCVARKRK